MHLNVFLVATLLSTCVSFGADRTLNALSPTEVWNRLESSLETASARELRTFVGRRVEFTGDDFGGATPARINPRSSEVRCEVYFTPAQARMYPHNRRVTHPARGPQNDLYPAFHIVGTVRLVDQRKKRVEIDALTIESKYETKPRPPKEPK